MLRNFFKPAAFWLVLGTGVFLRFHALDRQSLWNDEFSTLHTISTPARAILHRFATYDTHPPLYFLQLKIWRALSMRSLVKLRANSALWGSLSLVLAYGVGRLYGGNGLGLLTMAFLALSPFHLAYSQEMRPYAMAMAIALAALWSLERRSWWWVGILWTAQLYTHYWGAFVVTAQALHGFLNAHSRRDRQKVGAALAGAVAAFALWLPILAAQLGIIDQLAFWVPPFSFLNLGKVFLAFSGILFNMASWTFFLPTRVGILALIGLFFAFLLGLGFRRGPRAAVLWLGMLLIPWLLSLWKPSIFVWYRYPVHMLPAFALLIASGLTVRRATSDVEHRTWDVGRRTILIAVLLGSQAWGDWVYFHQWQKANPKAVVQYIHRLRLPNAVVVRPVYFSELFDFYDQGHTPAVDEHLLDSPEKRAQLKGRDILLLAFDVPSDPIAEALLAEYRKKSEQVFPGTARLGITVYHLQ